MKKTLPIILAALVALGLLAFGWFTYTQKSKTGEDTVETPLVSTSTNKCEKVRFADVGWTDIAATTGMAEVVLEALGYQTDKDLVSLPITFISLENKAVDVFLGNWMPANKALVKPYLERGNIEMLKVNLEGAKYTLAVSRNAYEGGVKNFADIAKFPEKFDKKIYGIEVGNDGNRLVQSMIDENAFGLQDFTLVESSESGMLTQVKRRTSRDQWIVFLGWEPHPMNTNYKMNYLEGGDDYFGPNLGGAIVNTIVRKGYATECPNVGKFLTNLEYTLESENQVMSAILDEGKDPKTAAKEWLQKNPNILNKWLDGVTTIDGKPSSVAIKSLLNN